MYCYKLMNGMSILTETKLIKLPLRVVGGCAVSPNEQTYWSDKPATIKFDMDSLLQPIPVTSVEFRVDLLEIVYAISDEDSNS